MVYVKHIKYNNASRVVVVFTFLLYNIHVFIEFNFSALSGFVA